MAKWKSHSCQHRVKQELKMGALKPGQLKNFFKCGGEIPVASGGLHTPSKYRILESSFYLCNQTLNNLSNSVNRFAASGDVQRHIIIHTGEKPHLCDICGRGKQESNSSLGFRINCRHALFTILLCHVRT